MRYLLTALSYNTTQNDTKSQEVKKILVTEIGRPHSCYIRVSSFQPCRFQDSLVSFLKTARVLAEYLLENLVNSRA
jgi:hypothetical protein